ncbi:hypothetical protein Q73A0000_06685 [Kaistella flava (ex Peng et al. 2021)]|uniref:Uncharacterized protein n=1 Tax=Kaistella flava (ex Peng et al. 2021) TaxID=2038776 RepID=A0A7M2Y8A8_9FLAO|nr:hypothetical protein [Kaistella flava (ex Peng et al. 2021)]QOW10069.1 hypothetical protein Q73A0000_06685 [Kaistella flava (ex Peng et al. 2021)]
MLNAFPATGKALLRHRFLPLLSPYLSNVKKDFFAHATTTRNKDKMRQRFNAVIKRKAVAERKEMWICGKSHRRILHLFLPQSHIYNSDNNDF